MNVCDGACSGESGVADDFVVIMYISAYFWDLQKQ